MTYFRVFSQPLRDKSRTGMQKFRLPYRILMYSVLVSKLFKVNVSCVLVDDLSFVLLSLYHDGMCSVKLRNNLAYA
jgi:hypothetical protein